MYPIRQAKINACSVISHSGNLRLGESAWYTWQAARESSFGNIFFFCHPKVSNLICTGSSQPPWETTRLGTQHETHFWSHHVISNAYKKYLAGEYPSLQKQSKQAILTKANYWMIFC